jgi:pSer/pThr/pTyr-binding forkhead associated (FHA) protein
MSMTETRLIVGRNTDRAHAADVHVDDEYVSNCHAAVTRRADGSVWVEDLGSLNGTFVNSVPV